MKIKCQSKHGADRDMVLGRQIRFIALEFVFRLTRANGVFVFTHELILTCLNLNPLLNPSPNGGT